MPQARNQKRQLAVGFGVVGLALGLGWGAMDIPSDAGYAGVGPNFLPWAVAVALLLCGITLLVGASRGGFKDMEERSTDDAPFWPGFLWMSAGLLLNAALITTIGFVFSCAVCFVLAARGLRSSQGQVSTGVRAWVVDSVVGLLIAAPAYWMFTKFLAINLPGLTSSGWL
jgi:putative tricarboxylic transport membrane protein